MKFQKNYYYYVVNLSMKLSISRLDLVTISSVVGICFGLIQSFNTLISPFLLFVFLVFFLLFTIC